MLPLLRIHKEGSGDERSEEGADAKCEVNGVHVRSRVSAFPDPQQQDVAPGVETAAGEALHEAGGIHEVEGGAVGQGSVGQAKQEESGGEKEVARIWNSIHEGSRQETPDQRTN